MQAWLCSCAYNRLLSVIGVAPCFHYLIAGGDQSLVISNELPEDNPPQGMMKINVHHMKVSIMKVRRSTAVVLQSK